MNPDHRKIKSARKRRGWTIDQAWPRAGVSRTTLINIEMGHTPNPSSQVLGKLAEAYGVTVDSLYSKEAANDPA